MDARITKQRLSWFLSYSWAKLLALLIGIVVVLEVFFSLTAVKPKAEQIFKIYYYPTVNAVGVKGLYNFAKNEAGLSYDVLEVNVEVLQDEAVKRVLDARLSAFDGTVIIADRVLTYLDGHDGEELYSKCSYFELIDSFSFFDAEGLLEKGKAYVDSFKTGGEIDENKVKEHFIARMKGDNRYRFDAAAREQGIKDEIERIKTLDKNLAAFEFLLVSYADEGLFTKYTKYQVSKYYYGYQDTPYDSETEKYYSLSAGFIDQNKKPSSPSISEVMTLEYGEGAGTVNDIVLCFFDFTSAKPDLQYETVIFINSLVKKYSTLLDGVDI